MKRLLYISILLIVFQHTVLGQHARVENLPKLDYENYHFGFMIGINNMDFVVTPTTNPQQFDSLLVIEPKPQLGFNIGIVSNLRLGKFLDLRFIPNLSFGERMLTYRIVRFDSLSTTINKRIESTFIDLPINLKFKSARLGNTRAYVLTGLKYTIDLASQAKKKEDKNEVIVKLLKNDFSFEVGVGFDFYLQYFKLGTEIKMSYGLKDILDRENNIYTNSIDKLNSKIFQISLTFEG